MIRGIENQWKREGKARFSGLRFWGFPLFFLWFSLFSFQKNIPPVTLVTAKNQHRCWKARALRVGTRRLNRLFCKVDVSISTYQQNKMSLFRDFFPLWVRIDPYTYRGASLKSTPHYDSTFTAKANPIYKTKNGLKNWGSKGQIIRSSKSYSGT